MQKPSDWQDHGGRPLYAGTLRGYRHFSVTASAAIRSVSQRYHYTDGENVAECMHLQRTRNRLLEAEEYEEFGPSAFSSDLARITEKVRALLARQEAEHAMKTCTCGFYASYDPETNFYTDTPANAVLFGVVEAYGGIVPATKGFRAEKVRIVAICPSASLFLQSNRSAKIFLGRAYPSVRFYDNKSKLVEDYPQADLTGLLGFNPLKAKQPPPPLWSEIP